MFAASSLGWGSNKCSELGFQVRFMVWNSCSRQSQHFQLWVSKLCWEGSLGLQLEFQMNPGNVVQMTKQPQNFCFTAKSTWKAFPQNWGPFLECVTYWGVWIWWLPSIFYAVFNNTPPILSSCPSYSHSPDDPLSLPRPVDCLSDFVTRANVFRAWWGRITKAVK